MPFPCLCGQIPEFSFMLKERVCPLVIRLFSPSIKYNLTMSPSTLGGGVAEKPSFPVCLRLLRIVGVLIKHFYVLLVGTFYSAEDNFLGQSGIEFQSFLSVCNLQYLLTDVDSDEFFLSDHLFAYSGKLPMCLLCPGVIVNYGCIPVHYSVC